MRCKRIRLFAAVCGVAVLACMGLPVSLAAQGSTAGAKAVVKPQSAVAPAAAATLSLQSIWQAPQLFDHTMLQRRRFFDGQSQPTAVRELLIVKANGSETPDFRLTYQGVEGQLTGSPVDLRWAQVYRLNSERFYRHGSFQIRELASAQQNYTLHTFSSVIRANRAATRVVIFPARLDKAIWVVDVDVQTSLPLYAAEFDRQFRLLSEVEVLSCSLSAQLPPASPPSATVVVTEARCFADALVEFEDDADLVEPDGQVLGEYQLCKVTVVEDLLNSRKSLHLTFTDGVDEFFVIEEPGATHPFAGLPSQSFPNQPAGSARANTIARYGDHAMRVLLFWQDGVAFQLAGRGSLARLDDFAKHVYVKALQN